MIEKNKITILCSICTLIFVSGGKGGCLACHMHWCQLRSPRGGRLDGFYFCLSFRRVYFWARKSQEKLDTQIRASPVCKSGLPLEVHRLSCAWCWGCCRYTSFPFLLPWLLTDVLKVWIEHLSLEFEHFALLHGMSKICCTCVCSAGLPAQILGDSAARASEVCFTSWCRCKDAAKSASTYLSTLERRFPRRPDLTYVDGLQYPAGCQGQASAIKLSLWQLGWHPDCSSKPPTFKPAARKLVDEFLTHSFTASDNLLLYQSESYPGRMENQQGAPIFFTHYVKGAARASTILMLAHVLVCKMDLDVASLNPRLYDSMLAVFCKESDIPTDAVAIALENATLSARRDIREQHDVITWLSKLLILKAKACHPLKSCSGGMRVQHAKQQW